MENFSALFYTLADSFSSAFVSTPTLRSFLTIITGWVLCPGRRTMTGIIRAAGYRAKKSHDAYQCFFSKARWDMDILWQQLFFMIVKFLPLNKPILIVGDDTLAKHYGKKIWGAGLYRDAVRSSKKYPAWCWGLNWVVLTVVFEMPLLKGHYIALPVMARLNPKTPSAEKKQKKKKGGLQKNKEIKKSTTVSLMCAMIHTLASWLPDRTFIFCGDGAYASVAKQLPANVHLVSRIRKDAAIYDTPQLKKAGKPGRPSTKGHRLPCPKDMSPVKKKSWLRLKLELYGKPSVREVFQFQAIWYEVCPQRPVNIIVVRDPKKQHDDEFFFSTDLTLSAEAMIYIYTGRWPIEVVFRESKQYLGFQDSQARTQKAVTRTAPFCLWLNALIKLWFIQEQQQGKIHLPTPDPWYTSKKTISFQDMLDVLRRSYWDNLFSGMSINDNNFEKISRDVINSLSKVA